MKSYYNSLSSFWMSDYSAKKVKERGRDLIKLAQYRRAISNFVNIVTGESIPVAFSDGHESYTDGDKVTISANLDDNNFDPVVGLALHEGSHIKLTNFQILNHLQHYPPKELVEDIKLKYKLSTDDAEWYVSEKLATLLNYVEDRRIDYYIYKNAPGYRGYYEALYNKFFHVKIVDKALKSEEHRNEEWESYMFRLINLVNKNTELDALKGLKNIWNILNIRDIQRLKSTKDALNVSIKIFKEIENNCLTDKEKMKKKQRESKAARKKQGKTSNCTKQIQLSDRQKQSIKKAFGKQKDFLGGKIKKSRLSKGDHKKIEALEEAGVEIKKIDYDNGYRIKPIEVVVIKNMTRKFIDEDPHSIFAADYYADELQANVDEGLMLGQMLGKRLKVINENRVTTFNRQQRGRIDKRLLSELGTGNPRIFYRNQVDTYKNSFVHISIDGSGSMGGRPIRNAIKTAVATAKAASMNQGINVVISFRFTGKVGKYQKPIVLIAYDSRKDKISKIKLLFKNIAAAGVTPESLCFEAIKNEILIGNKETSKYFINMSDGAPNFHDKATQTHYGGATAHKHCRKLIKEFEREDIKILSYFIKSYWHGEDDAKVSDYFNKMYGSKNTACISSYGITEIAKTLNKMFLSHDNIVSV